MSKRILLVLLTLGMLAASSAYASRAKEIVMGTGDAGTILMGGSLYYDEVYNIFYNPSYVNDFKNWAIIEKSNFPGGTAQGGFATSIMGFETAFYLNRGNAITTGPSLAKGAGAAVGYVTAPVRPFEIFVGNDMGVKWGLGLTYGNRTASTTAASSSDVSLHFGLQASGLEPFVTFKVAGNDNLSTTTAKHKFMRIGTRYKWGEWVPYVAYAKWTDTPAGGTDTTETNWGLGMGRNTKLGDSARMNYAVSYWMVKDSNGTDTKRSILPIDLALEGDATSWLTLRAGLSYRLMDRTTGTGATGSAVDNTTGRVGATVHVNKVDLDWAFGKTGSAVGAEAANNADAQSWDVANNFFTATSLTYRW